VWDQVFGRISGKGAVLLNSLRFMLDKRKKHDDEEGDGDEDNIQVQQLEKLFLR